MSVWLGDPEKGGKRKRQVFTVCLYFYPRGQASSLCQVLARYQASGRALGMDGAELREWQQCSMCVSGQQLGKVYYSLPLGVLFPLLLFKESEPNRYSRGRRGGFGEQRERQQMEMDGKG